MQNKLLSSRMVAQMGRLAVPLLLAGLCVGSAMAGTGGSEFDQVYDTLIDWMQGTLGRIIAITMLFVGIAYGVVRQSIIAAVVFVASGLVLYNAQAVIEAVMTATVVSADKVALVASLSNGLM